MVQKPDPSDSLLDCVIHSNTLSQQLLDTLISISKSAFTLKQRNDSNVLYYQNVAELIKKEMDSTYGSTWHVVCGERFGCFISAENGKSALIQISQMVN